MGLRGPLKRSSGRVYVRLMSSTYECRNCASSEGKRAMSHSAVSVLGSRPKGRFSSMCATTACGSAALLRAT